MSLLIAENTATQTKHAVQVFKASAPFPKGTHKKGTATVAKVSKTKKFGKHF